MLTFFCAVVGVGRPFPVDVAESDTVGHLKDYIQAKKGYRFAADEMDLYKAYKNGAWLDAASAKAMTLSDCDKDLSLMDPTYLLIDGDLLGNFHRQDGDVHVLVKLPPGCLNSDAFCPQLSNWDLMQPNRLPDGMEFSQAMEIPLGFKIPIGMATFVTAWPDVFSFGDAGYGSALSLFLENPYYDPCSAASEVTVTSNDSIWLHIFQSACGCTLYRDQSDPLSSRTLTRPDVVMSKSNAMVGKCVPKADDTAMEAARKELTANLAPAAYSKFPQGLTSIPAWTTCATRIYLHKLSFVSATNEFEATPFKTYNIVTEAGRVSFIVDLFKIVKWVMSVRKPKQSMRLIPGVRTKTTNWDYVTWGNDGLVKEFELNADEIDMALIERIYKAKLNHVERGRCTNKTVTITSVGQTLRDAVVEHEIPRDVILKQVRAALDELHNIKVAHCNVRAENVFVLDDQRVILGNLKYCRPRDAPPPPRFEDKSCPTALQLDEHQYRKFEEDLAELYNETRFAS